MKKIITMLMMCISVLVAGGICINDVHAAQDDSRDLINKVTSFRWDTRCGDHDNVWGTHSIAVVGFAWGTGCYDEYGENHCAVIEDSFHCIEPGDKCTKKSVLLSDNIIVRQSELYKERKGYKTISCEHNSRQVCYAVIIPAKEKFQDIKGWIKKDRQYRMTAKYVGISKDCYGNDKTSTIADDVKTDLVWYGRTATVYNQNINNYRFLGWSKTKSKSGIISSSSEYRAVLKKNETIYAIYEKINNVQDEDCSEAIDCAEWTPASYSADITSTVSKVLNKTIGTGFEDDYVYAKPGDDIFWKHCYFPGVQRKADEKVTVESSHNRDGADLPAPYTYNLIQKKISEVIKWQNQYKITTLPGGFSTAKSNHSESFPIGDDSVQSYDDGSYSVENSRVGSEIAEGMESGEPISVTITNHGPHSWDCWYELVDSYSVCDVTETAEDGSVTCTSSHLVEVWDYTHICSHPEDYINYIVDKGPAKDDAKVRIPYNFHNRTKIESRGYNDIVFAGDSVSIDFSLNNLPKDNEVTQGTYATKSQSKWKLRVCYGDGISYGDSTYNEEHDDMDEGEAINMGTTCIDSSESGLTTLNGENDEEGEKRFMYASVNVPDINAGLGMCVQSAVWAQNSGADTNYTEPEGNHQWSYSPTIVCFTVAKKPSLQVWGGNVYTRNGIATSTMIKGNIAGRNNYEVIKGYEEQLFGSWAELGVISNGEVAGFASGASTGYGSDDTDGKLSPNPNGGHIAQDKIGGTSSNTDFCKRSVLTIANEKCSSGVSGNIGVTTMYNRISKDKEAIVNKLIDDNSITIETDTANLNDGGNYYKNNDDITVGAAALGRDSLKVVHAKGNISIVGDIEYEGNGYSKLYQVPKAVIYANGNVYIDCKVGRIDALIMADGDVYTCADKNGNVPDVDARERSKQLIINGAIIANALLPDRTYGAAPGSNSMVSAEIINFDPTLYLWAGYTYTEEDGEKEITLHGELDTTYIHELAPRR